MWKCELWIDESCFYNSTMTLRSAKNIIFTYIDKCTVLTPKHKRREKPNEPQATVRSIPKHLERAKAVARFCLSHRIWHLGVLPPLSWPGC
ncbi:hypothetical protein TNCV_1308981 [Trichonephila clavipes]|nr:hypothetical protein TNCV_1308981 [Trichonephila clavipes]